MNDTKFGGCPYCGRQDCVAGSCNQPAQATPEQSSAVAESLTERQGLIHALREDAIDHKEVAHSIDMRPEDSANWQHALNCAAAADMLEADAREAALMAGTLESRDRNIETLATENRRLQDELNKAKLHIQHIGNDAMRSENARLQAELADLKSIADSDDGAGGDGMRLVLRNRKLEAELAALKADAARYRWLRDVADAADWESLGYQVDIDASIDVLMKGAS